MRTSVNDQSLKIASTLKCPGCGLDFETGNILRVPIEANSDTMLRSELGELLDELCYARCPRCKSLTACDARRTPGLLDRLYEALPDQYWAQLSNPAVLARTLERFLDEYGAQGDVWDVGCGDGRLLSSLSDRRRKHGIEPGRAAVATAREAGLDVRQGTVSSLALKDAADAVLLIDVVEHLPHPATELQSIYDLLRPGGVLAVFTGRADSPCARLVGPHWYYLHCVGHVSILSREGLTGLLERAGFTAIRSCLVEHPGARGAVRWTRRLLGNVIRKVFNRPRAAFPYFRDHQLVLARKPQ